jgi:ribonucleoside-diphosphate reductase alpha chain
VYLQAYELGCKGCTTYRPNEITGAVLEVRDRKPGRDAAGTAAGTAGAARAAPRDVYEAGGVVYMTRPLDRPEALPGRTYKLRWPEAITPSTSPSTTSCRTAAAAIRGLHQFQEHGALRLDRRPHAHDLAVFRRGGDVSASSSRS